MDDGTPCPDSGFIATIPTLRGDPADRIISACANLTAGSSRQNSFELFTDNDLCGSTDPRLVSYDAMKIHLLAAARSFEPVWCQAGPIELMNYFDFRVYNRPPMGLAWMIWFNPALAALITPPRYSNTIVERFEDGSLFLATSKETFDVRNTRHLEEARQIHRQIDPLNYTVPFEGLSGRSDRVPPFPKL